MEHETRFCWVSLQRVWDYIFGVVEEFENTCTVDFANEFKLFTAVNVFGMQLVKMLHRVFAELG